MTTPWYFAQRYGNRQCRRELATNGYISGQTINAKPACNKMKVRALKLLKDMAK